MRDRNLLSLFVAAAAALAGAFAIYLFLSSNGQPKVVSTTFPKVTNVAHAAPAPRSPAPPSNVGTNVAKATNALPKPVVVAANGTNTIHATNVALKPVFTEKKFTWKEVESPDYTSYLNSLRAVEHPAKPGGSGARRHSAWVGLSTHSIA